MKAKKREERKRKHFSAMTVLFSGFVVLILLASVLISINTGSGKFSKSKSWLSLGIKELIKKGGSPVTGADVTVQGISIQGGANATSCGEVSGDLTLTADVSSAGTCFKINASDITLDCDNHFITGNKTGYGVYINSRQGITVKNCNVNNFSRGIRLDNSSDNNLTNNNIYSNGDDGIFLYSNSNNNSLTDNKVYNTIINGIRLQNSCYNNTLSSNKIYDNSKGILLSNSNNNTIYNNYFDNTNNVQDNGNNSWNTTYNCSSGSNIVGGPCMGGNAWSDYNGTDINSDGIGDTLIPYNNSNNIQAGGDYLPLLFPRCGNVSNNLILNQNLTTNGTCFTVTADNIEIDCQGYTIEGDDGASDYGIEMNSHDNVTIKNCTIKDFDRGVSAVTSHYLTVEYSNITSNVGSGVYGESSDYWTIRNNHFSDNLGNNQYSGALVFAKYSDRWNVTGNTFIDNKYSLQMLGDASSQPTTWNNIVNNTFTSSVSNSRVVWCSNCYNNTFDSNNFTGFSVGGDGYVFNSAGSNYDNRFVNNTFADSITGIYLGSSDNYNTVADNQFFNLSNAVYFQYNADNNTLKDNHFINNSIGLYLAGNAPASKQQIYDNEFNGSTTYAIKFHNVANTNQQFYNNYVNGYEFKFCNNNATWQLSDFTIATPKVTNYGAIILRNCGNKVLDNITISDHVTSDSSFSMMIYSSANVTVRNSNLTSNTGGIYLLSSDKATFVDDVFTSNTRHGIYIEDSDEGNVSNCTFTGVTGTSQYEGGMVFYSSADYWKVTNNNFTSNSIGIDMQGVISSSKSFNSITNNTFSNSGGNGYGMKNYGANNNTFADNAFSDFNYAISLYNGQGNNFTNNNFLNNTNGFYLYNNNNYNILGDNDFIDNTDGLSIGSNTNTNNEIYNNEFNGSTDYDVYFNGMNRLYQRWGENFADGYPFYICRNNNSWSLSDYLIPVDRVTRYGSLIIEGCTNAVLNNVSVVNHANSVYGYGGVMIYASSNVSVNNSNFTGNENGLRIENSNKAVFQNSVFKSNDGDGLYIQNSDYGTVLNCTFSDQTVSSGSGVHFKNYNDYWNISQNSFNNNDISVYVYSGTSGWYNNNNTINNNTFIGGGSSYGVYAGVAKDNMIRNNNFSGYTDTGSREAAITLYYQVARTTISNNSIKEGYRGIYVESAANTTVADNELINNSHYAIEVVGANADDNWFYKNNFENNTNSPPVSCNDADNYFNTSSSAGGGNYWDDYQSVTGVACADGNSDGFCDTPYNISSSINDSLPYVYPVGKAGISCGDTITTDTNLTANLTCSGTALTIGADNVVLDCAGHKINYSTAGTVGYGVNNSGGFNNVTIKNCNIYEGNVSGNYKSAIYFDNVSKGYIENNNVTTIGNYGVGVYLNGASNVSVNETRIDTSGNYGYGIYLNDTNNTLVKRANITTSGNGGWGVYMSGMATLNNFSNCQVFSSGASPAVYLKGDNVDNNVIEYSYIEVNSSNSLVVYVDNGDGNKFLYNVINQSNTDGVNALELYNNANSNILVGNNMSNAKSTIFNESYAVLYILNSQGTNVSGNRFDNINQLSFYVEGSNASQYNHTFSNNLGDGIPVEYIGPDDTRNSLEDVNLKELFITKDNFVVNNATIDNSEGVRIVYANKVVINKTKINASLGDVARSVKGLYLDQANNASVEGVNITASGKNGHGIYLDKAKGNNFYGVKVTTLGDGRGIYLKDATSRNNFSNCEIRSSSSAPVYLNGNYVDNNVIEYSYIEAKGSSWGVDVSGGDGNRFLYNVINQSSTSGYGAFYLGSFSDNNTLIRNNISNARTSFNEFFGAVLDIYDSQGTNVLGNRFDNVNQSKVYVDATSGATTFADNYFGVSNGDVRANSLRTAAGTALLNFSNNIFVGPKFDLDGFQFNMSNTTFRSADGTADIVYPSLLFNGSSNFRLNASNVYVLDNISAVDPASVNLSESFNTSAEVSFYKANCSRFGIYYNSSFVNNYTVLTSGSAVATQDDIGGSCDGGVCTNIACSGETLTMTVPEWSSFALGEGAAGISCGDTITTNTNLTANLTCSGTALTIGADNVVLDCAGYKINYSTAGILGYGINNSGGFDNVTIKNCNIYEGNATIEYKYGIYFKYGAENGTIENNNITTIGHSDGIFLSSHFTQVTSNEIITTATGQGIDLGGSSNNITNNFVDSAQEGIYTTGSNNKLANNTVKANGFGIHLDFPAGNNTLLNNNVSTGSTEISDDTGNSHINYLIYNNSLGEIRWTDESDGGFLKNLTIDGDIGLGANLFIGNNTAALNTSAFSNSKINSSADITLRGLSFSKVDVLKRWEGYSTNSAEIIAQGTNCDGTSCSILSYGSGVLVFNTSSFSSFAGNENKAPNVSTPVITPSLAYTNTNLTANTTYTDPDGETGTIYFKWHVNGIKVFNQTNSSVANGTVVEAGLSGGNFSKGDKVNVSVYANDGSNNSGTKWSNTVTILNTAPTFDEALADQIAYTGQEFIYDVNCSDVDGDTITYDDNTSSLFDINSSTGLIKDTPAGNEVGNYSVEISCGDGEVNVSQTFNYVVNDGTAPEVTLVSPTDGYVNNSVPLVNVTFSCKATDNYQLKNISLYITNANNQMFSLNQSTNVGGTVNSSNWTLELKVGDYTWNCLAYDNASQSRWGGSNRSVKLNYAVAAPSGRGGFHRRAACSDKRDNDGDGLIDRDDPGCHRYNNLSDAYLPDKIDEDRDIECTEDRCEGILVNRCLNNYYYRERGVFKWESIESIYGEGWGCVEGKVKKIEAAPPEEVLPAANISIPAPVEEVKEVVEKPLKLTWWQRWWRWLKEKGQEIGSWFKGEGKSTGKAFGNMGEVLVDLSWLWIILVIILLCSLGGYYAYRRLHLGGHKEEAGQREHILDKVIKKSVKVFGKGWWIILSGLVGFLDAIFSWPVKEMMALKEALRRRRKKKVEEELVRKKEERKEKRQERKEKAWELERFIVGSMNQGISNEDIKMMLENKGWPKEIVEEYVGEIERKIAKAKERLKSPEERKLGRSLRKVEKELERTEEEGYLRKNYKKVKKRKQVKKEAEKVAEKPVLKKKEDKWGKKLKKDLDYVEEELSKLS